MALEAILSAKHDEVARAKRERPAPRLLAELPAPARPFASALSGHTSFLLECKRRSPSQGVLREPYDPAALARAFEPVADGISCSPTGPSSAAAWRICDVWRRQSPARSCARTS